MSAEEFRLHIKPPVRLKLEKLVRYGPGDGRLYCGIFFCAALMDLQPAELVLDALLRSLWRKRYRHRKACLARQRALPGQAVVPVAVAREGVDRAELARVAFGGEVAEAGWSPAEAATGAAETEAAMRRGPR